MLMENIGITAIGLFMVTMIFWSGVMYQRVISLEEWRAEVKGQLKEISSSLTELVTMFRNGGPT